jgi:hypothetical protein
MTRGEVKATFYKHFCIFWEQKHKKIWIKPVSEKFSLRSETRGLKAGVIGASTL